MEGQMTKDELVQGFMGIGFSRQDAEEAASIQLGISKGDCVAVDSEGREYTAREIRELQADKQKSVA
jgi:hypothetical protein